MEEQTMEEEQKTNFFFTDIKEIKSVFDLPINVVGITLNIQQIDLIRLSEASSIEEIEEIFQENQMDYPFHKQVVITADDFEKIKKESFSVYLNSLLNHEFEYKETSELWKIRLEKLQMLGMLPTSIIPELEMKLTRNEHLTEKEIKTIFLSYVNEEQFTKISFVLKEKIRIAREGIKELALSSYQKLSQELAKYQEIIVRKEASYKESCLLNGDFSFKELERMIHFARENKKQIHISGIFDDMYFPEIAIDLSEKEYQKNQFKKYWNSLIHVIAKENPLAIRKEMVVSLDFGNFIKKNNKLLNLFSLKELILLCMSLKQIIPETKWIYQETYQDSVEFQERFIQIIQYFDQLSKTGRPLIEGIGIKTQFTLTDNLDSFQNFLMKLKQFSFPILIQEFDVASSTEMINHTSKDQILSQKNQKTIEFYQLLSSLEGTIPLTNISIGSINDLQNEWLDVQNKERFLQKQSLIKTLYGGYYNFQIQELGEEFSQLEGLQLFQYHIHTTYGSKKGNSMEDFITTAIQMGMKAIGFAEPIPLPELKLPENTFSMTKNENEKYLQEINALKKKYEGQIEILSGYEASYEKDLEEYLFDLSEQVDYLVLKVEDVKGVPFSYEKDSNKKHLTDPTYPLRYAEVVCRAMESGLYDFIARPDYFMKYHADFIGKTSEPLFLKNALLASQMILKEAEKYQIPLELDLEELLLYEDDFMDKKYTYPNPFFWNNVKEVNPIVIYGLDSNCCEDLMKMEHWQERVERFVPIEQLNLLNDYHPLEKKKQNEIRQKQLELTKQNLETYEVRYILNLLQEVVSTFDQDTTFSDIQVGVKFYLNNEQKEQQKEKERIEKELQNNELKENTIRSLNTLLTTYQARIEALERAKDSYELAIQMGSNKTSELFLTMSSITEVKTTRSRIRQEQALERLRAFQRQKQESNIS